MHFGVSKLLFSVGRSLFIRIAYCDHRFDLHFFSGYSELLRHTFPQVLPDHAFFSGSIGLFWYFRMLLRFWIKGRIMTILLTFFEQVYKILLEEGMKIRFGASKTMAANKRGEP